MILTKRPMWPNWERFFAWLPVETINDEVVWLEPVYRQFLMVKCKYYPIYKRIK